MINLILSPVFIPSLPSSERYKMRGCSAFFFRLSRSAEDSCKSSQGCYRHPNLLPAALLLLPSWEMQYDGMNPPGRAPHTAQGSNLTQVHHSPLHTWALLWNLLAHFLFFLSSKNQSHWVNKMRRKITEASWQRGGRHPTRGASTAKSRKEMDVR